MRILSSLSSDEPIHIPPYEAVEGVYLSEAAQAGWTADGFSAEVHNQKIQDLGRNILILDAIPGWRLISRLQELLHLAHSDLYTEVDVKEHGEWKRKEPDCLVPGCIVQL